jgi:osmotically-inducible protein OsmY
MNDYQDGHVASPPLSSPQGASGQSAPPVGLASLLSKGSDAASADGAAARLAARIARVVERRTSRTIHNLRVEVRRDGVFLDGQCECFYSKQLAQQAAMGLADDKQLTNRIKVAEK